jgi:molecular chaperone HscC
LLIGIDLGTTNSAVGVWRDGRAELIPNSLGHLLTPSAVSLDEGAGGEVMVGLGARERQSTHPNLTATAFKRYMGSARVTRLGQRDFLPEELSALVLRQLKADAEAFLGEAVTEAVITVPAYFNDKQRKATRRAGELAGLKVERLLNEPTAAALAYGIHQAGNETRFLVFDLGGGTFDVSILELFDGVIEVRASTGDNRLGGEDFNEVLVEAFRDKAGDAIKAADRTDATLRERLREAAERTRRALTDQPTAPMSVTWRDQTLEHEISAEDFEELAAPLLARLKEPVLRSLRDSDVRPEALQEIVLVGGATRMPVVRKAVTRMFGRFPSNAVHPDEAVAIGAAIQAGLKARDAALKEVVLTDVCPYTLGVEVGERDAAGVVRTGLFSPIIERNTVIPASRMHTYHPMDERQREVRLGIYQGESRKVADNIHLGEVTVPVPPGKMAEAAIEVRFTYDINGLLEVDVHVPLTGERRELVIVDEDAAVSIDMDKRRAALAALKQHPRDADANRHALARAERCYENSLGDTRTHVARLTTEFEAVLDRQDPREVERARAAFLSALDGIEGETWL